mgnify:CR=1 FL=1
MSMGTMDTIIGVAFFAVFVVGPFLELYKLLCGS